MAFCTQCGARLPEAARFCPRCGAPVAAPDTPARTEAAVERHEQASERPAARGPARDRDLPPEGLHFGPDPRPASRPATNDTTRVDRHATVDEADEDEDEHGGTGTRLLVILALVAVAVLGIVFWQQREGARPVAETSMNASAPADNSSDEPSAEPTEVAAVPTPEPTPAPSPTPELAQVGDEIGSPASLDPNGEAAIPAAAIDAAFADDPARAYAEFPGPVTVRGSVIGLLSDSPPALSLEGYQRGGIVVADLARGQGDAVDLLARGSVVRLRCASVRRQAGTTILNGCRI